MNALHAEHGTGDGGDVLFSIKKPCCIYTCMLKCIMPSELYSTKSKKNGKQQKGYGKDPWAMALVK